MQLPEVLPLRTREDLLIVDHLKACSGLEARVRQGPWLLQIRLLSNAYLPADTSSMVTPGSTSNNDMHSLAQDVWVVRLATATLVPSHSGCDTISANAARAAGKRRTCSPLRSRTAPVFESRVKGEPPRSSNISGVLRAHTAAEPKSYQASFVRGLRPTHSCQVKLHQVRTMQYCPGQTLPAYKSSTYQSERLAAVATTKLTDEADLNSNMLVRAYQLGALLHLWDRELRDCKRRGRSLGGHFTAATACDLSLRAACCCAASAATTATAAVDAQRRTSQAPRCVGGLLQ